MRRFSRSIALAAALVAASFVLAPTAASAIVPRTDLNNFTFDSFNAQYYLSRDPDGLARLKVVETLVAEFPTYDQNHGILRDIPRYIHDNPLQISNLSVTDQAEKPVAYTSSDVQGFGQTSDVKFTELKIGSADTFVHGKTTYVISYELRNVVVNYADTNDDELFLDVNGTGWSQKFGQVSATAHIAAPLVSAENGLTACFYGEYGSTTRCELGRGPDGSEFTVSADAIGPGSTLSFDIGFASGTFTQPALAKDSWILTIAPRAIFLFTIALIVIALLVRLVFWRDTPGKGIIVAQYTAPTDQDLLIAGDLVHRESTALAAQFVDLAVRGFVNIVDVTPQSAGTASDTFALEYVKSTGATTQELRVLDALFGDSKASKEQVNLATLSETKGAALFAMRSKARQRSMSQKLRELPKGNIAKFLRRFTWLVVIAFVSIIIWTFAVDVDSSPVWVWAILSLIACIVMSSILTKPQRLTAEGAERRDYLLGIRDYLRLAEAERFRLLQSPSGALRIDITDRRAIVQLNEKLLPFAVLFGVEREWSNELQVQYAAISQDPTWLSSGLNTINFGTMMSNFSASSSSSVRPLVTTSSGTSSSWSSSGGSSFSSGFSGGGFSGGGGGGGGGGGW